MISNAFQHFWCFSVLLYNNYFQHILNKELNSFNLGNQHRRGIGENVGKADITTKSSVAKSSNVYSTARKFNCPRSKQIRTSPLDHRTVSISRRWFAYCANQYSTMFGVDMRKADLKSEQNDTSGRGERAQNIYSSARQFQCLESTQNQTSWSLLIYIIL